MNYYDGVKTMGLSGSVGYVDVWMLVEICGYFGFCSDWWIRYLWMPVHHHHDIMALGEFYQELRRPQRHTYVDYVDVPHSITRSACLYQSISPVYISLYIHGLVSYRV